MSTIKVHRITPDDSWEMLWKAWDLARVNYTLTLTLVFLFFIGALFSAIPLIGPLVAGVVTALAPLVFLNACSYWEQGEKSDFSQVMSVYKDQKKLNALLPLLGLQFFLAVIPGLVGLIPILAFIGGILSLITIPLSIVISIAIPILFFNYKDMDYMEALTLATRGSLKNFFPLFVLVTIICFLGFLSLLAMVVGIIFVALPVYMTTPYLWYRAVYEGLEFEKGTEKSLL